MYQRVVAAVHAFLPAWILRSQLAQMISLHRPYLAEVPNKEDDLGRLLDIEAGNIYSILTSDLFDP